MQLNSQRSHSRMRLAGNSNCEGEGMAVIRTFVLALLLVMMGAPPALAAQEHAAPSQVTAPRVQPLASSILVGPEHACNGKICAGFVRLPPRSVVPLSASGSNGRVSIYLTGSGLTVNSWLTTADTASSDGTICDPTAYFWAKSPNASQYYVVDLVTINECAAGNGYWYAYFENGGSSSWQNDTRLGNTWDPNPPYVGFPTELVHS